MIRQSAEFHADTFDELMDTIGEAMPSVNEGNLVRLEIIFDEIWHATVEWTV